jgi:hypothetical protein
MIALSVICLAAAVLGCKPRALLMVGAIVFGAAAAGAEPYPVSVRLASPKLKAGAVVTVRLYSDAGCGAVVHQQDVTLGTDADLQAVKFKVPKLALAGELQATLDIPEGLPAQVYADASGTGVVPAMPCQLQVATIAQPAPEEPTGPATLGTALEVLDGGGATVGYFAGFYSAPCGFHVIRFTGSGPELNAYDRCTQTLQGSWFPIDGLLEAN